MCPGFKSAFACDRDGCGHMPPVGNKEVEVERCVCYCCCTAHTRRKKTKKPTMQPHRCSAVCMLIKIRAHSSAGFFFFFFSSTPFFPSEIVTARRSLQLAVRCVATPPTTKCHRSVCRSVGWMCHRIWLVAARRLEKESSGAYRGGVHGISVCQRGENQSVGMLLKLHVFQMDFCMEITE